MTRPTRRPLQTLDPTKIRRYRIRQGWGEHTLSAVLGVSIRATYRLEHGADQRLLTLAFVDDLTKSLGCTITDLLADQPTPTPPNNPDNVTNNDPATVGAVLATNGGPVHIDTLATSLNWTLERLNIALDTLETRLAATGQRLAWHLDTHVALSPLDVPAPILKQVARQGILDEGLTFSELRCLIEIATNGPRLYRRAWPRVLILRLADANLLNIAILPTKQPNDRNSEAARLTDICRYNLVLDN